MCNVGGGYTSLVVAISDAERLSQLPIYFLSIPARIHVEGVAKTGDLGRSLFACPLLLLRGGVCLGTAETTQKNGDEQNETKPTSAKQHITIHITHSFSPSTAAVRCHCRFVSFADSPALVEIGGNPRLAGLTFAPTARSPSATTGRGGEAWGGQSR